MGLCVHEAAWRIFLGARPLVRPPDFPWRAHRGFRFGVRWFSINANALIWAIMGFAVGTVMMLWIFTQS
jgi:hypothetical protein